MFHVCSRRLLAPFDRLRVIVQQLDSMYQLVLYIAKEVQAQTLANEQLHIRVDTIVGHVTDLEFKLINIESIVSTIPAISQQIEAKFAPVPDKISLDENIYTLRRTAKSVIESLTQCHLLIQKLADGVRDVHRQLKK